ncbi:hypothetical protein [Dactylosporangium darangshiense]|uniref:hypothetical protein n=1 Tax=Dactylosporangium darangshiense TaxID=579108 RepID=UPI0031EF5C01
MTDQASNRRPRDADSWLPPDVATALVEHDQLAEARQLADHGDWHCSAPWRRTARAGAG